MRYKNTNPEKMKRYGIVTVILLLLLLLGVSAFVRQLYVRIVDESRMIAWEMTLKSARVLDLRMDNIRRNLIAFTNEMAVGEVSEEEVNELIAGELDNHRIFRMYVVDQDGTLLTDAYGMDGEESQHETNQLAALCPEDSVFSTSYIGKSGCWQTAIAYSGKISGNPCRVYLECILDELYLEDFMEFYNNQGYSYVISGEDGEFIMLPQNKFGQGLYSGLFTMLEAYKGNTPEVIDKVRRAMKIKEGCTVQLEFRKENSFFCFVPLKEGSDWFVVSVIPAKAIQKNGMDAIIVVVLMGVMLLCGICCLLVLNRRRWKLRLEVEAAKQADKAKTSFLSNMSHEMRTPMNAIIGMAEIMRLNMADRERMEDCINKIHVSSKYLLDIINDVLDMSKIENNKMILDNSPFLIGHVLDLTMNLVMPQIKKYGHDFSAYTYWQGSEILIGDGKRISQILVNILVNAAKYTPKGGKISLRVFCEKDVSKENHTLLRFEIEDNGIGMSREFQKIIFEPFSQEKNSLSKGTGLGMAITAQMIHLMGGEIIVKSELNKGSTFRVFLSLPNAWKDEKKEKTLCGKRVLVLDGEHEGNKALRCTLSAAGMQVLFAESPDCALALLHQGERIDIILMDSKLSSSAEELVKLSRKEGILLYLTGYGLEETDTGWLVQSDGFLVKPILPSRLLNLIEKKEMSKTLEDGKSLFKGRHILLAEDNELNAEIAIELLEHFGAEVEWSKNGKEVCQEFKRSIPGWYDLILMDIQMPELNGYEAAAQIRSLERQDAGIPILAMTADAFAEDVSCALKSGMNGHIAKPVDIQKLLQEIRKVMGEKR